jgi:hypothetical protein
MVALVLGSRGYTLTEHRRTMEGLLTHVATADCFLARPHPALECGIVSAWWRLQVKADGPLHQHHEDTTGRHPRGKQIT